MKKALDPVQDVLGVQAHRLLVADTDMAGLFIVGNSNGIVVPKVIEPEELRVLERLAKTLDINLLLLRTRETALGNLVLVNDKGCVIAPELRAVRTELRDALGVDVETGTIAGLEIVGTCGVATNRGVLVHRGASEQELSHIESVLGVHGDIGSVAFGSPFVGAGVLANSHGFVTSRQTTGPELQRIDEALGFVGSYKE